MQTNANDISHVMTGQKNHGDDSLFGQFGNDEDFRPAVMDISETPIPHRESTPIGAKPPNQINADAIQMQMNMMQ